MDRSALLLAIALGAASPAAAQAPLTLAEAFRRADAAGYANRIADGASRSQSAQVTAALRGILPTLRVEGGVARTDDPLAAFGFTLQQRSVTAAAFDPMRLNAPDPVTNWHGSVVAEIPIFNADALVGRTAAAKLADAARANAGWVRATTRAEVTRAYFAAILAREQARTLVSAVTAATAHVRQAESMVNNGLATRSDALLASIQQGRFEAQLLGAEGNATIARERLALLLGQPGDTSFTLPDSLPAAMRVRALANVTTGDAAATRLDVTAAQFGLDAANRDGLRAKAGYLPRLNGFARSDWNSADRFFGGRSSYTLGVMASWSPFRGAAQIADRDATQGRTASARAALEATEVGAALERSAARTLLSVAIAQLEIARASLAQATEAHRIVERKYAGGLATIAELLGAATAENDSRLGLAEARFQVIVAAAAAHLAAGDDLTALTQLEN
ncbi:MAG: TolC family protein [Gemmatimonadales bacterium]